MGFQDWEEAIDTSYLTGDLGLSGPSDVIHRMRWKIAFGVAVAFFGGVVFTLECLPLVPAWSSPVVGGRVVDRATTAGPWGIPSVDFAIEVEGSRDLVHAITAGHLLNKVPEQVRFRFSGDPTREVFLHDHEENPFWIAILCWSGFLLFAVLLIRNWKKGKDAPGARDRS